MTMGSRIRQARLEAGMSQRQLAGEMMTRNMLSALEHDGANPSVNTLKYLSEKLCKPISYFLGEDVQKIPEISQMKLVRQCFEDGEFGRCLNEIKLIGEPVFEPELALLETLCLLELAEEARRGGKLPYCRELLRMCEAAMDRCAYMKKELKKKWLLESALAAPEKERAKYTAQLDAEDEVLLLRAEEAMENGASQKAGRILDAVEDQKGEKWNLLRGELYFAQQEYAKAAECYLRAQELSPEKTTQRLEICYREMGDYKMAYYYAKKGK